MISVSIQYIAQSTIMTKVKHMANYGSTMTSHICHSWACYEMFITRIWWYTDLVMRRLNCVLKSTPNHDNIGLVLFAQNCTTASQTAMWHLQDLVTKPHLLSCQLSQLSHWLDWSWVMGTLTARDWCLCVILSLLRRLIPENLTFIKGMNWAS